MRLFVGRVVLAASIILGAIAGIYGHWIIGVILFLFVANSGLGLVNSGSTRRNLGMEDSIDLTFFLYLALAAIGTISAFLCLLMPVIFYFWDFHRDHIWIVMISLAFISAISELLAKRVKQNM